MFERVLAKKHFFSRLAIDDDGDDVDDGNYVLDKKLTCLFNHLSIDEDGDHDHDDHDNV